ncbi:MAG: hypothetical protein Q7S51_11110 [Gallionellaceae bacterium]|nr:hypothetical protein [Gallionellaceae bacterium]
MLAPHQQNIYDAARADQLLSLERGVAPTVNELLQLAADMANSRGVEKIQTMERDPTTLEIVSTTTVEARSYERFLYTLSGRLSALIEFYNLATRAGAKLSFKKNKAS